MTIYTGVHTRYHDVPRRLRRQRSAIDECIDPPAKRRLFL